MNEDNNNDIADTDSSDEASATAPDESDILDGRRIAAKKQQKQLEEARKQRAAQKLRENLQRRKQQSRARRAGDPDETSGLPAAHVSAAKRDESSS